MFGISVALLVLVGQPTGPEDFFDELGGPSPENRKDALMGQLDRRSEPLTLLDAETGRRISGAKVILRYPDAKRNRVATFRATTDEDGVAYVPWAILEGAADREFCLAAEHPGYDHLRRSLGVQETVLGTRGAGLRFLMAPSGRRAPTVERCALDIIEKLDRPKTKITVMVHFPFGQHVLTETGRAQAVEIATAVAAVCKTFPKARFRLRGHTDARGTARYNRALSLRRARAVAAEVARLHPRLECPVGTEGAGENEPAAFGDDDAAHARNRRVEVIRRR